MRKTTPLILILMVLILLAFAPVSRAQTRSEFQSWTAIFLQARLDVVLPGLVHWFDLHARRGGTSTQLLVRPGLGYQFHKYLTFHVGYAYIPTWPDDGARINEHRIWQQFVAAGPIKPISLMGRLRLEQRFHAAGSDVGLRFRLMGRIDYRPHPKVPFIFVLWDEAFLHLINSSWGPVQGFDQNRLFAGIGLLGFPGMRFEIGYLNVFVYRPSGTSDLNHNLSVNLFLNF